MCGALLLLGACGSKKSTDKPEDKTTGEQTSPTAAGDKLNTTAPKASFLGGMFRKGTGKRLSKLDIAAAFSKKLPSLKLAAKSRLAAQSHGTTEVLWQLAPADAVFGIVVGDGTGTKLASALTEIQRVLRARPGGKKIIDDVRADTGYPKFDFFDVATWAGRSGVDLSLGAALFATSDEQILVVLPLSAPDTFRKQVGADPEEFGPKRCVVHQKRYVCSQTKDFVTAALTPHDSPLAKRVAAMPNWLRGDIEVTAHLPSFSKARSGLSKLGAILPDAGTLAVAARLEHGGISLRGWLEGKRGGPIGSQFASTPPASLSSLSGGAVNWLNVRLPMSLLMGVLPVQMEQAGVDFRTALFGNLTGELVAYSRGTKFLSERIELGIRNPGQVSVAVRKVCELLNVLGALDGFKGGKGGCGGKVDIGALLGKTGPVAKTLFSGMPKVPASIRVTDSTLALSIGTVAPPGGKVASNTGNAVAEQLITGDWNIAQWGMAFDPLGIAPGPLYERVTKHLVAKMDADDRARLDLIRWLYAHLYEAGIAVSLRPDGIYFLAEATTFAADDVGYRLYEDAVVRLLDGDRPGYQRAMATIARKHPKQLAGRHAALVGKGVPLLAQVGPGVATLGALGWLGAVNKDRKPKPARRAQ